MKRNRIGLKESTFSASGIAVVNYEGRYVIEYGRRDAESDPLSVQGLHVAWNRTVDCWLLADGRHFMEDCEGQYYGIGNTYDLAALDYFMNRLVPREVDERHYPSEQPK